MKKEIMEPFDIDKIVREKLQETHDLHSAEMESARPFVWSAVQKQIGEKRQLTWLHLAAAVVFLITCFSVVLFTVQQNHRNEISLLSDKMNQLEQNYRLQAEAVHAKDIQVQTLAGEFKTLEARLANNQQIPKQVIEKPKYEQAQIVYRTDTVYIKQVEYITTVSIPMTPEVNLPEDEVFEPARMQSDVAQKRETDDIIFPSYQTQSKKQATESMKFRIGSMVTKSN